MEIKILSLNVAFVRAFFGLISFKENIDQRMNIIVDTILKYPIDQQPDIILLQEIFVHADKIARKLKNIYPHSYLDTSGGAFIVGVNSGLAIYSKYPIIDKVKHTYENAIGDSMLAKKGIMGVRIKIDQDTKLCIFNTHLQAGQNDNIFIKLMERIFHSYDRTLSTNQIRFLQLYDASNIIKKFAKGDNVFFAGDFNINAADDTIFPHPLHQVNKMNIIVNQMINLIFPESDTFDPDRSPEKYSVYDGKRIDYILQLNELLGYSYIINTFTPQMTDHRGIMGKFILP